MNRHQYAARQLAPRSGVASRAIRSGTMSSDQWAQVYKAAGQVGRPNFLVDDKTFDVQRFEERIGQAVMMLDRIGHSLDLIVFDYLQLFKDMRRKDKRVEVGDIINGIREIANAYEVPVIVVSSLSRAGYKNDAKPNLYDTKSQAILSMLPLSAFRCGVNRTRRRSRWRSRRIVTGKPGNSSTSRDG